MAKISVEQIKRESRGLRGQIVETLQSDATHFEESELQLLKFHGTYQQDDRDLRLERRKQKLDKAWSFMIRSKMPGGRLTAGQYLMHDDLAEKVGNHTLRLTTRQGIQMHGVLMGNLKDVIASIKSSGLTTWGACGDVVRNTMSPASPIKDAAHADAQKLAEELSETFLAKSCAYSDIWLNGEKLDLDDPGAAEPEEEIYGNVYLPRKFKIGLAIPPCNDVDIFSQDVALAPYLADGEVAGYNLWIGGGFGMTHGMEKTRPCLAKPLAYVEREHVVEVVKAVVLVQREYGNRKDRKQARLKYLVENTSRAWFRNAILQRVSSSSITLHGMKEMAFDSVSDNLGWHEQGDGKLFRCIHVAQGRVEDPGEGPHYRAAFRALAENIGAPMIVTPNCNLIVHEIDPAQREQVDSILAEHRVPVETGFTAARQVAHACVALPTCGLSLSESERVFGDVLDGIDDILRDLGLENEPLLVRMTGCPNGCARPYNSDIAFVGRSPKKYAMYVGGSHRGDRLAGLHTKVVEFDDIPAVVRTLLEDFAGNRNEGETFTDYWGRARELGPEPDPMQFHVELEERSRRNERSGSD